MLKTGEKIRRFLTVFITWAVLVMSFLGYEKYFVNREEEFLTAKAMKSSLNPTNGAQIERSLFNL